MQLSIDNFRGCSPARLVNGGASALLLTAACALSLLLSPAMPPVFAQGMGGRLAPAAQPNDPNATDKSLAFGHVPDLDDLTPHTRDIQRRGLVARDPSGKPQSASDWMNQSMKWLKAEEYEHAADGFRHAAAIYQARGLGEDALVMSTYAARCESRVGLFYETAPHVQALREKMTTGRRLEPIYGAYAGAFIDHEMQVDSSYQDEDESTGRQHRDAAEFNAKIGKKHAAFFTYCGYKSGKPDKWFANLKENGAAAQWAIEPNSLEEIHDDEWLHGMAQAAADAGIPVFVRFASEMNGGWTPYHTPPALYREKFQMVARVFHQIAPNVAMVWCPNEIPQSNIADYYPGDDAVDWVGVNFYSVYYNNGDANRPVAWCNPADKLEYVYAHYAAKHPIMICEWAATHHEKADGVDRPAFAAEKIAQLYSALPRRYPRIKAVFWLDMNAIEYANDPATRKNDYSLLSTPRVAGAYKRMVNAPYFLDHVSGDAIASRETVALADRTVLRGKVNLSAYVKTYEGSPTVVWSVNGAPMQSLTDPGAYEWTLNTATLPNGPAKIGVTVLDSKGRVAVRQSATVFVQNGGGPDTVVVDPHPAPPRPLPAPPIPHPAPPVHPSAPTPTLGDALSAARMDNTLSLTVTPANGVVIIGARGRDGIRITAAVGGSRYLGASPTLVLLLLRGSGGGATVETLAPADTTAGALAGMAAAPGVSVSVPRNPTHLLRPDAAGSYTVRALLLPTREAAQALLEALSGTSPTWSGTLDALRSTPLSAQSAVVYVADRRIEVTGP